MYCCPFGWCCLVERQQAGWGIYRVIAALLGILVSAGRTRITGMLLHGTFCCFRVLFIRTHATLIILVIWFTNAALFVPSFPIPRNLSRSIPCVNWEVPTIYFIVVYIYMYIVYHRLGLSLLSLSLLSLCVCSVSFCSAAAALTCWYCCCSVWYCCCCCVLQIVKWLLSSS